MNFKYGDYPGLSCGQNLIAWALTSRHFSLAGVRDIWQKSERLKYEKDSTTIARLNIQGG